MDIYLAITFFILGIIIGSFLNVVIYRLNTKKTLGGRSACMSCMNKLSWYELIPLFSFLGLGGRCKNCKTKISIQYPLVEFVTGLIFASLFWKLSAGGDIYIWFNKTFLITYVYYAVAFSLLVVIATYDLKHKIIPDALSFVFGALAFVGLFFFAGGVLYPHIPSVVELASGLLIAFPFAFFWAVSGGRWMGLGDAKLALGIGWLLGLALGLSSLVLAFWSGAIVGVVLIILSRNSTMKKLGMKSEIPFAPFLVLGVFLVFFIGVNLFGF